MKLSAFFEKSILRTIILGIIVIIFFVCIVLGYYSMVHEEKRSNIIKDGRMAASSSADELERYLSPNIDFVNFTAYTLNEMIEEKRSDQEIHDFMVAQSTAVRNAVIENSTGLYGYINGTFQSGTNWEPPADYVATDRPWYTNPMKNPGELTMLEPYTDVQSGNTMLALGKTLSDGVSVISVDVSIERMQKLTEEAVINGGSDIEMILTGEGVVVTHSDINEVGKDYSKETDTFGAQVYKRLKETDEYYFEFDHNGENYIVYDAIFEGDWHCISVQNATEVFSSLRNILIATILLIIAIVLILGSMTAISGRRALTARKAVAESEAKTEFLSRMSHEIRTPINAVLGLNEMILREADDRKVLDYSEKIRDSGQELLKLVNELLDYSQNENALDPVRERRQFTASKATILTVDDNPMNIEVLKSLLKRTLINIDSASDGFDGLDMMKRKKYDLIFLDHMMPGKDGMETLNELKGKKNGINHNTPVVCVTANVIKGARDMYLKEGFDDYLSKPLDSERIEELLIKYIPGDKIEYIESEEIKDGADDKEIMIPECLKVLEDYEKIDLYEGIRNSGSPEAYLSLLKIYHSSVDDKCKELNGYLERGDISNYTIKIHALKSSSRIIGALSLEKKAKKLEDAGNINDLDKIKSGHEIFISEYLEFKEVLSGIFSKDDEDDDKPEAGEDLMKEAFGALRAAADDMDCDRLQGIFEEMDDYKIPENDIEIWKEIRKASDIYDYGTIVKLIDDRD